MTKQLGLLLAISLASLSSVTAEAEPSVFDGYNIVNPANNDPSTAAGQANIMKAASGNASADGIAAGMYNTNTKQIEYTDQQAAVDSRKNGAATAGKSAGTGSAVHAAVGAAMAATATPMLASPIASVRAAGAALMAKAILEFAQSGADSGVKDKNNAQKDLLTQTAGQDQQAKGETKPSLPAEAQKILSERGVNPDDFAQKVESGELNSTEDVLRAMGDTGEYSADDLAQGEAMANAETAKAFADAHPIEPTMDKLGYDESNATASSGGGGVVGGRGATSDLDKLLSEAAGNPGGAEHTWAANNTSASKGKGEGAAGAVLAGVNVSPADLLNSLLGKAGAGPLSPAMSDLMNRLGIAPARKKQNIFHIARRNYRSWGKWRAKILRLVAAH